MNKLTLFFLFTTFALLVVAGVLIFKPTLPKISLFNFGAGEVSASPYQAVFLANGQVYFGKLSGFNTQEPLLSNVYYLKVGTALTPGTAGKQSNVAVEETKKATTGKKTAVPEKPVQATPAAVPVSKTTLTLVKLGTEVHGPTGDLKLNRDQILFVENLREDSQVVQAIKKSEAAPASK